MILVTPMLDFHIYAPVTDKHNFGQTLYLQQVYLESTDILKVFHVKF